jgi:carbonic anhydrase/acetyltransferase-like protein (isoleucine patch superfamily)
VKIPAGVFSSGLYQRFRNDLMQAVVRWNEGVAVLHRPGPPVVTVDQPSAAKMRVHHGANDPPIHVGRYCAIHETVLLMPGSQHDIAAVGMYFFGWNSGVGPREEPGVRGPITIGADVWIGRDTLVYGGVTIGTGAVVATRAVVTKDVAPYEIVGGVPARHIGWRFDEPLRAGLLRVAWWDWPVDDVFAHVTQIQSHDVAGFVARHGGFPDSAEAAEKCAVCSDQFVSHSKVDS